MPTYAQRSDPAFADVGPPAGLEPGRSSDTLLNCVLPPPAGHDVFADMPRFVCRHPYIDAHRRALLSGSTTSVWRLGAVP